MTRSLLFRVLTLVVGVAAAAPSGANRADAQTSTAPDADIVAVDGICTLAEAIHCANGDCTVSGDDCKYLRASDEGVYVSLRDGRHRVGVRDDDDTSIPPPPTGLTATLYLPLGLVPVRPGGRTALPVVRGKVEIANGTLERDPDARPLRFLEIAPGGEVVLQDVRMYGGDPTTWYDAQTGGAILVHPGGRLTMRTSLLADNAADAGGAIAASGATVALWCSWLVGNVARDGNGGGISISGTEHAPAVVNMTCGGFVGNRATSGGGVDISGKVHGTFTDTTFADNGSLAGQGGGLNVDEGTVDIVDAMFDGNWADSRGGGLNVDGGASVTATRVTFEDNFAHAGGAASNSGGSLSLIECDLRSNGADSGGGGLFHTGIETRLIASTIRDNRAGWMGGGAFLGASFDRPPFSVVGCTMTGNQAHDTGGAVFRALGRVDIVASTIAGNSALDPSGSHGLDGGSGIYSYDDRTDGDSRGALRLAGTIVAGNRGAPDCGGVIPTSGGYNLDAGTSCGLAGPGDMSGKDPLLAPLGENGLAPLTHALLPGSPAIDRIPIGAVGCGTDLPRDQRGMPRPSAGQGRCDIGAYER